MTEHPEAEFRTRSYWMETAPYEPGPPLDGDRRVDVAIVGGGYCGLWAAYHLKQAQPSLDVAVLESDVVGYGASGRNGGFVMSLVSRSLAALRAEYGVEEGRAAHEAVVQAIDAIGRFCSEHGVDCEYEKNGLLTVSTAAWQDESIREDVRAAQEMGIEDVRFVDGEELRGMVHSPTYRCAFEERSCAIVNPAKLAWAIAHVAREQGVTIYERTEVKAVRQTATGVEVRTPRGVLRADKAVLATNAYSVHFPEIARWVIPIYTYIVLTEPLTPSQWEAIGWAGRHGIEDRMGGFHYYRPTMDGRIAWGGETYPYRSAVNPRFDHDKRVFADLRASLVKTFPPLAGIRFTHEWGGPVGITARFVPTFGTVQGGRIHYGVGYCGHGVAPTYVGGEILRDLALDRDTDRTNLCFVRRQPIAYPPQPLRSLLVNSALRLMKEQDQKEGRASPSLMLRAAMWFEQRRRARAGGD